MEYGSARSFLRNLLFISFGILGTKSGLVSENAILLASKSSSGGKIFNKSNKVVPRGTCRKGGGMSKISTNG